MRTWPKPGPVQVKETLGLFSSDPTQLEQVSKVGGSAVDVAVSSSISTPPAMVLIPPATVLMPLSPENPNALVRPLICCRATEFAASSSAQSLNPENGGSPRMPLWLRSSPGAATASGVRKSLFQSSGAEKVALGRSGSRPSTRTAGGSFGSRGVPSQCAVAYRLPVAACSC